MFSSASPIETREREKEERNEREKRRENKEEKEEARNGREKRERRQKKRETASLFLKICPLLFLFPPLLSRNAAGVFNDTRQLAKTVGMKPPGQVRTGKGGEKARAAGVGGSVVVIAARKNKNEKIDSLSLSQNSLSLSTTSLCSNAFRSFQELLKAI